MTEEGIDRRFVTAEADIKNHGVFASSCLKYICTERICRSLVEYSIFLKEFEPVAVKYFSPHICVIPRCVTIASEYMLEIRRTITISQFLRHPKTFVILCFKFIYIYNLTILRVNMSVGKIEEGSTYSFSHVKSCTMSRGSL